MNIKINHSFVILPVWYFILPHTARRADEIPSCSTSFWHTGPQICTMYPWDIRIVLVSSSANLFTASLLQYVYVLLCRDMSTWNFGTQMEKTGHWEVKESSINKNNPPLHSSYTRGVLGKGCVMWSFIKFHHHWGGKRASCTWITCLSEWRGERTGCFIRYLRFILVYWLNTQKTSINLHSLTDKLEKKEGYHYDGVHRKVSFMQELQSNALIMCI